MSVGVLKSLTRERGAARGRADDEAPCHLVAGCPHRITRALEPEHRVEDVDRDQWLTVRGVGGARGGEGRKASRLVDADVQDLALCALLIGEQLLTVHGGVLLPAGVVDLGGGEVRVHAEGARLIRDDRHDAVPEVLGLQKILEQTGEGHRRGYLLLA